MEGKREGEERESLLTDVRASGVARARVVVFTHLCGRGLLEGGSLIDGHRSSIVVVFGAFAIGVVNVDKLCGRPVFDTGCAVDHGSVCVGGGGRKGEREKREKVFVAFLIVVS